MAKRKKIITNTVMDIIDSYKDLLPSNFRKYIKILLTEEDVSIFTKKVDMELKKLNLGTNFKEYQEKKFEFEYQIIKRYLENNKEINTNNKMKLKILGHIYKDFSDKMDEESLDNLRNVILRGKEYIIFEFEADKYGKEYEIITKGGPQRVRDIKEKRQRELFQNVIIKIINAEDIESIIDKKYINLEFKTSVFDIIKKKLLFEFFINQKKISIEEFKQSAKTGNFDADYMEEFKEEFKEYFANNLQFLDKTNLLLNAAARIIVGIKIVKGEEINGVTLKRATTDKYEEQLTLEEESQLTGSLNLVRDIYNELGKDGYYDGLYGISGDDGTEIIRVSREKIGEFLQRCTKNNYITDTDIENIHNQILEGILPEDLDERRIANVNIQDLINLSKSYETKEEDEEKTKLMYCAVKLAEYLKSEDIVNNKKLLNLYFNGEIDLDIIKNIDMSEITPEEYNQKFKLIYDRIIYSISEEEKDEEQQKLSRLAELYKHLETEGKTNIDDLIANLITAYGEDYGTDVMYDLYNLKMVSIETAVGWIGDDILLKICEKDGLPPEKIRQLFENEIIEIDSIAKIVNTLLDDTSEKTMFIGIIFSDDEENWTELVKRCIKIEKGAKEQIENNVERKHKQGPIYTEHVIEAFERTRKIRSIDVEYYVETGIVDGHVIAHLPKFQKVIIEKMFDRKGNTAHDAATYRLSKKYFEKNRYRIIEEGKVHRKVLFEDYRREDISTEDIDRKIHNIKTWGKGIDEWFGIESESRWNEDELKDAEEKGKDKRKQVGENK